MFKGRYEYTIDLQGRVSVPSRFREILSQISGDHAVITNDFDPCLVVYPLTAWQDFERAISEKPQFHESIKHLKRFYISGAVECSVDKQGRIMIPPSLREYAHLKKEIVIVGQVRTIEIWDKETWEKVFRSSRDGFNPHTLAELGL